MEQESETAVTHTTYRIQIRPKTAVNHTKLVQAAHQLGLTHLTAIHPSRLIFLQGHLTPEDATRLANELLVDPVTERLEIGDWSLDAAQNLQSPISNLHFIETTLLPGVTDPPADNLRRAAELLGISSLERVATGQCFELAGDLSQTDKQRLATELLANPVIQRFAIDEPISPPFFAYQAGDGLVEKIALRGADDEALLTISQERRLALNLEEMQAVRAYYEQEGRDATDVELEMIAQTWSEHCVHKTFKAIIEFEGPLPGQTSGSERQTIDGLLNTYIRAATEKVNKPWVHSAFVDNAGIVAFDDLFDLAFKVETHNHPSALEPFGGANTGVGGVVRDVLGVSARPIANTDVLCFGLPDTPQEALPVGVLHPRRIAEGVIHGIEDYGNKMGIPTVNGSIHYHPGYTANPLVYCGCLGILPHGSHVTEPQPGDLIIAIGGRTGRDGLRGATFSSMEMDVATSEIAGTAVQIGHPIMEKQVQEVVLQARDAQLYTAITDCGAGGFSSAVGEMGEKLGATVQLENITTKYPGLRPWELWLSEAQERMVLAVPSTNLPALQAICDGQDVELVNLGTFGNDGRLHIYFGDKLVGNLTMHFLHDGLPPRHMTAKWELTDPANVTLSPGHPLTLSDRLLALLSHPDIRSKEEVIRRYDHEVQGGTAVKPLTGVQNHGPSDATVLVPQNSLQKEIGDWRVETESQSPKGVALSNGICPNYTDLDPYAMAWAAVDEAMRNVVAVGADPDQVSILDNFCWGNPNLPDRLGSLVRCAQGCYDAAVSFQTPFISGKDSLNNEYTGADGKKHAIPGTLLISAIGIVPDVSKTVTMDLKQAGNFLFMVGDTRAELGGSHFNQVGGRAEGSRTVPQPVPDSLTRMRRLHRAIQAGLVQSCHDCAEGGVAVALAEMCIAGRIGAELQLIHVPRDWHAAYSTDEVVLFAESLSRFLVEVRPEDAPRFRELLADVPHACVAVVGGESLVVNGRTGESSLTLTVEEMEQAWRGHLDDFRLTGAKPSRSDIDDFRLSSRQEPNRKSKIQNRKSPKVLVLHANGTNRDHDAALACTLAGGEPEIVHINQLLAGERRLADYGMMVLPGGFSYGDDLGAGVLWALDLRERFGEALKEFVRNGRPVLGICNGFQTLVKAGLLPGTRHSPLATRTTTLTYNQSNQFECRWVTLQPNPNSPSLFTQGLTEPIYCPVAHGEGRLMVQDAAALATLQRENLIPLQYSISNFQSPISYPANPNGSVLDIAALCNPAGNVLGLMPHPENHIFPWQHPRASRGEGGMLGLQLFENGIRNA
ncbi:phosphoribosylformylglycinamidine synthase subunit PurL [Candidatus Leptofilum sp.]|uniref:phosphoribosylformylglycinamidine synthase subunit PurL n=1 Tax=Candidatus Leptofilum sp. TaxID=3241576 RepID=UPI003B5CF7B7